MAKVRLDELLVDRGLFATAHDAAAAIMAGEVKVDDSRVTQAGTQVNPEVQIECKCRGRFVSRGGEKLQGALEVFELDIVDRRCIDVGASTGGFTDCLLQAGATSVVAVDVGYGQLAWSLRSDPRVTVFDRTNIRDAGIETLGGPFDVLVCDASFIPLKKLLPKFRELTSAFGFSLVLVKPQFEVRKDELGIKGVVRDPSVHERVLREVVEEATQAGFSVRDLAYSPVTGPEGNIEFLLLLGSRDDPASFDSGIIEAKIESVVRQAHELLGDNR